MKLSFPVPRSLFRVPCSLLPVRYGVFGLILALLAGCVEIGRLLGPTPGDPPAPNFNRNENDNVSTNGNANDNIGTNGNTNDNASTNGNQNANDNANDNGNLNANDNIADEDAPLFGGIGDIPPLEGEVNTTASGLKFIDIEVGAGETPLPTSMVTVNYTGWLTDGTEFDSGQSVQFSLQGVVAGFAEGVGSMRLGGSRRLLIPPDLAYGESGSPPSIPPNATLVFDIDLLEIQN